jgi:hypothetical protein
MSSNSREPVTAALESTSGTDQAVQRIVLGMKRPAIGAAIAGAEVIGTAVVFGVAETLVAAAAAYVVFRCVEEGCRDKRSP